SGWARASVRARTARYKASRSPEGWLAVPVTAFMAILCGLGRGANGRRGLLTASLQARSSLQWPPRGRFQPCRRHGFVRAAGRGAILLRPGAAICLRKTAPPVTRKHQEFGRFSLSPEAPL